MDGDAYPLMDESLVYRKTRLGAAELAATHGTLSPPARRVLILLDGRRPVSELAALFGVEAVERAISELEAHGYARRVETVGEDQTTTLVLRTLTGTTVPAHGGLSPRTGTGTVGRDAEQSGSAPRKGRLGWVLLLFATAALGSGFWMFGRAAHTANTAADPPSVAVAADARGPDRGQVSLAADSREEPALTPPPQPVRELPLSGLPEVIVKAPGAPAPTVAAVTQPVARARRPVESAATSEAPLAPAGLAPTATSTPVVATADQTVGTATAISESRPPDPPAVSAATAPADTRAREAQPAAPQAAPVAPAPAVAPEPAQALRTPPGAPATAAGQPPTQLASLAPPQAPASAPVELRTRKRVQPEFPARALRSGIREGHVLARVWVTPEGKVDQVDIVSATPARAFDEEVRRALSLWTFDPPGRSTNATIELSFKP